MNDDIAKFFAGLRTIAVEIIEAEEQPDLITWYACTVRSEIDNLLGRLKELPPELREDQAYGVARLVDGAIRLGIRLPPELTPYLKHKAENEKAAAARAVREKKQLDINDVREKAIKAEAGDSLDSMRPRKLAQSIHEKVNCRLKEANCKEISDRTIERCIRAILQKCH